METKHLLSFFYPVHPTHPRTAGEGNILKELLKAYAGKKLNLKGKVKGDVSKCVRWVECLPMALWMDKMDKVLNMV